MVSLRKRIVSSALPDETMAEKFNEFSQTPSLGSLGEHRDRLLGPL
jgi:hypothetical protein